MKSLKKNKKELDGAKRYEMGGTVYYAKGGKLKMVTDPDTGKKVPFFMVD
tara:strand:- start:10300 stop:10449 length:150 start_codon:yes stop_codon:yes gene_type:complete